MDIFKEPYLVVADACECNSEYESASNEYESASNEYESASNEYESVSEEIHTSDNFDFVNGHFIMSNDHNDDNISDILKYCFIRTHKSNSVSKSGCMDWIKV